MRYYDPLFIEEAIGGLERLSNVTIQKKFQPRFIQFPSLCFLPPNSAASHRPGSQLGNLQEGGVELDRVGSVWFGLPWGKGEGERACSQL